MTKTVQIALVTLVAAMISATAAAQVSDPCGCKPRLGKKPYRQAAKSETHFDKFAKSTHTLAPSDLHSWQGIYAKKMNGKTVGRVTERKTGTPEDSLYVLKGTMWFVRREIDCDYHIQIGTADKKAGGRAVVEVTHQNCGLQKEIEDTLAARKYPLGVEFKRGIPVTVVGLGFFDWQHKLKPAPKSEGPNSPLRKQEGTAWELHPVKDIQFR